jgi:1-acyl-sn-glycerol-3-phosphate acyltransferase
MRFFIVGYVLLVYRVRVIAPSGPYVIAPMHRSMLDIPLVGAVTTRRVRFMGKESLFRVPVLGTIFSALGGYAVARDGSDFGPVRESLKMLAAGEPVVVYPEGTRQHGPEIAPLQPGAVYLALKANVPIVPVGIAGAEEIVRNRKGRFWGFARIVVVVGDPIPPPERETSVVKRAVVDDFSADLRVRLQQLYDEDYRIRDGKARV